MTSSTSSDLDFTLSLSGGGVAALGHIPMLGVLDELGLRPKAISGTSMGSVVAACYASGMSAVDMEAHVHKILHTRRALAWQFIRDGWSAIGKTSISAPKVLNFMLPEVMKPCLEDMEIPTFIIATDYNARQTKVFDSGNTIDALSASIATPGVFQPVVLNERIYVDGGVTNNLPVDVLPPSEHTIAIDVASLPYTDDTTIPSPLTAVTESVRIMMYALTKCRLEARENVILIRPGSRVLGALEFNRMEEALELAMPQKDDLKKELEAIMSNSLKKKPIIYSQGLAP